MILSTPHRGRHHGPLVEGGRAQPPTQPLQPQTQLHRLVHRCRLLALGCRSGGLLASRQCHGGVPWQAHNCTSDVLPHVEQLGEIGGDSGGSGGDGSSAGGLFGLLLQSLGQKVGGLQKQFRRAQP